MNLSGLNLDIEKKEDVLLLLPAMDAAIEMLLRMKDNTVAHYKKCIDTDIEKYKKMKESIAVFIKSNTVKL